MFVGAIVVPTVCVRTMFRRTLLAVGVLTLRPSFPAMRITLAIVIRAAPIETIPLRALPVSRRPLGAFGYSEHGVS